MAPARRIHERRFALAVAAVERSACRRKGANRRRPAGMLRRKVQRSRACWLNVGVGGVWIQAQLAQGSHNLCFSIASGKQQTQGRVVVWPLFAACRSGWPACHALVLSSQQPSSAALLGHCIGRKMSREVAAWRKQWYGGGVARRRRRPPHS